MNWIHLVWRSLAFHRRSHFGVFLGTATAAAVLLGALGVGDSVRATLLSRAAMRLGQSTAVLYQPDRFFSVAQSSHDGTTSPDTSAGSVDVWPKEENSALLLPAAIARQDGEARVNRIQLFGVSPAFFKLGWVPLTLTPSSPGDVWINAALARRLDVGVGDAIVLRVHKPSALSLDAVISPRDDQSVALRGNVAGIIRSENLGDFSLAADQSAPLNAFVDRTTLASLTGLANRANLFVASQQDLPESFATDASASANAGSMKSRFIDGWQRGWMPHHKMRAQSPLLEESVPSPAEVWQGVLRQQFQLEDLELSVTYRHLSDPTTALDAHRWIELRTRRIFLDPSIVKVAQSLSLSNPTNLPASSSRSPETATLFGEPLPILTYLVNSLSHEDRLTPYSMVTAAGPPYTPANLRNDEIVITDWLAEDLGIGPGDTLQLAYYKVDSGSALLEETRSFKVHSVVPMTGWHADPSLMPEFPGLSKAESTHDWDAGFELEHPIREKDEAYWKSYRGTPKAFISRGAGAALWANKFGEQTALRWLAYTNAPSSALTHEAAQSALATLRNDLRTHLDPADSGWRFQPTASEAMRAATSGQDFGGLFLGFSFFLILSALLLTVVLFSFGLEQRASEIGLLFALGWPIGRVRRIYLFEGICVATLGTMLGMLGGEYYGRSVIHGLNTIWQDAVAGTELIHAVSPSTRLIGAFSSIALATAALAFVLHRATKRTARELLNEGLTSNVLVQSSGSKSTGVSQHLGRWMPWLLGVGGIVLAGLSVTLNPDQRPGAYFGSGSLGLLAVLLGWRRFLLRGRRPTPPAGQASDSSRASEYRGLKGSTLQTRWDLARRGPARQPGRSIAVVGLLASATFLIVAVASNRLDATRDSSLRTSGTGGFALWAQTTMPVVEDLNSDNGRERFGLDPSDAEGIAVVPLRVRDGDDASCLNLNRAIRPRLLGVNPEALASRGAFKFVGALAGHDRAEGWSLLRLSRFAEDGVVEIAAIGDANSIQWALGKKVGDTLDYQDSLGRAFRVRIVGSVANSILQGNLIIAESEFVRAFPGEAGYRAFLLDMASDAQAAPDGDGGDSNRELQAATWSRALQDVGWEAVWTTDRLNDFNAVQNTYLNTFQILGGLGLVLGSIGLGAIVLRNVFERRAELGLLQAVGYSRTRVRRLVLAEHVVLLVGGVCVGAVTALLPMVPHLLASADAFPWTSLGITLVVVLVNGLLWTVWAARSATRGSLLSALRGE